MDLRLRPPGRRREHRTCPRPAPRRIPRRVEGRARGRRPQRPRTRRDPDRTPGRDHPRDRQVPAPGGHRLLRRVHRAHADRPPGDRPAADQAVRCPARSRRPRPRRLRAARQRHRGGARRRPEPRRGPHPPQLPERRARDRPHQRLPERCRRQGSPVPVVQARFVTDPGAAAAAAAVRDLRLLAARRGGAPARRPSRPRRDPLVGPARGLPHRGPRADEGPDGQERTDRAGRREGRLRRQAAPERRWPRGPAKGGDRLLQDVPVGDARHHRQHRRGRRSSRPAG